MSAARSGDERGGGLARLRAAVPRTWAALRRAAPFAAGVAAALLAMVVYSAANPPPAPLTTAQVSTAVARAMASATPPPPYSALVYGAIQPSLVLIQADGPGEDGGLEHSLGSGVVVTERAEILTALHVVSPTTAISVTFADGTTTGATIAAANPEKDIATLLPDELPGLLVPAVLGNPGALRVGDEAYAVGNPFGLYGSLSAGVISAFDRSFRRESTGEPIAGLIQIDTVVNPGNSGGPLCNRYGQVVGIVVGLLNPTDEEFFVGIGFAVPIDVIGVGGGGQGPQY